MLIQQIVNGLTLGSMYSLVALGYTLIFGVFNILNFAHAETIVVGAFGVILVSKFFALGISQAILLGGLLGAGFGLVIERIAVRPVLHTNQMAPIITTLGVSVVIESGLNLYFGPGQKKFPNLIDNPDIVWGSVSFSTSQLIILGLAIILMISLSVLMHSTKLGKAIRATAENQAIAQSLGIRVTSIMKLTMVLCSMLGGVTGVLLALNFGAMTPYSGQYFGVKALMIVVLGGMGSIKGAMLAGILLGLIETFSTALFSSDIRQLIPLIIVIAFMMLRPQGIFSSQS